MLMMHKQLKFALSKIPDTTPIKKCSMIGGSLCRVLPSVCTTTSHLPKPISKEYVTLGKVAKAMIRTRLASTASASMLSIILLMCRLLFQGVTKLEMFYAFSTHTANTCPTQVMKIPEECSKTSKV